MLFHKFLSIAQGCSQYNDEPTQILELDKARLIVMNRRNYIDREASFNYRQGDSSQKPTYLKLMLEVTKNLIELLGLQSIKDSQDEVERMEQLKTELPLLEKLLTKKN